MLIRACVVDQCPPLTQCHSAAEKDVVVAGIIRDDQPVRHELPGAACALERDMRPMIFRFVASSVTLKQPASWFGVASK